MSSKQTREFESMSDPSFPMGNEILIEVAEFIQDNRHLLDTDFVDQLEMCNTISRIWEIALCRHLSIHCKLPITKSNEFEWDLEIDNKVISIEATIKKLDFTELHNLSDSTLKKQETEMEYLADRLRSAIDRKSKDFKRKKSLLQNRGIILAITWKMTCFRIPEHYREYAINKVHSLLKDSPEISAILIGWDWPYWFPEISKIHIGAVIKKPNDFILIENQNASIKLSPNLNLHCDKVLQKGAIL